MYSIIFFGSDQYSAVVLSNLIKHSFFTIHALVTDRPKPKSRDQIITSNPVEKLAAKYQIKTLYYPANLTNMGKFINTLKSLVHDQPSTHLIGLCASFDHLFPPKVIDLFSDNLFNLHPSLLPQYRNVSPVQYALALGDKVTGITLFKITAGIDNGKIVAQTSELIRPEDTTPDLTSRLFTSGAKLFATYLKNKNHQGQNFAKFSNPLIFTKRLTKNSGLINWSVLHQLLLNKPISLSQVTNELLKLRLERNLPNDSPHVILQDLFRALTPWPSVWTIANTAKGPLRLVLVSNPISNPPFQVLISGKPKPIDWQEFVRYYL